MREVPLSGKVVEKVRLDREWPGKSREELWDVSKGAGWLKILHEVKKKEGKRHITQSRRSGGVGAYCELGASHCCPLGEARVAIWRTGAWAPAWRPVEPQNAGKL